MVSAVTGRESAGNAGNRGADVETDDERSLVAAWRDLLDRHSAVSGAIERALQEQHGIGVSEFEALERLVEGGEDNCRAQDLTAALPLSQSAASRLIARLEREGLVVRSMCELDRRGIFVQLTDEGRERYYAALPTQRAVLAAMLRRT